ncbi:low temperature requirement protein A [Streptococcus sp. SGI.013]|uniref:low temperature requirement protein A n=1 Tax=unclassified Streptococcus TaxID=2608887 RepID=UPI003CFCCD36
MYLNKYGERDGLDIYTIIASMFVVGQLSLNFSNDFEQTALPFFIFISLAYGLISLQYYLRGKRIGFTNDIKNSLYMYGAYILIFLLSCIAMALNVWTYDEKSLLVFYIPFVISYLFKDKLSHDVMNFPHIVERCQLITIITFGETVIAILKNYPIQTHLFDSVILFLAMAFSFMFYISQTYLNINHHQKTNVATLLYAHMVLVLGINFFTVSVEVLPSEHTSLGFPFLLIGFLLYYLGILMTSRYNQDLYRIGKTVWLQYALNLFITIILLVVSQHHLLLIATILAVSSYLMVRITHRHRRLSKKGSSL